MALDSTTWTSQGAVAFNAGSIADVAEIITKTGNNISRAIGATSTPTTTEVTDWVTQGKQDLSETFGFTWKRSFVYADTVSGTSRYSLPADYDGGAYIVRDLTQDKRLSPIDPMVFDTKYPDPENDGSTAPKYYCIKDRELWLHKPADGVYRLELEYDRSGDDATASTLTYIPDIMRHKIVHYCTYMAFLRLQNFQAAQMYKAEWELGLRKSKGSDGKKKWEQMGYQAKNWQYQTRPYSGATR